MSIGNKGWVFLDLQYKIVWTNCFPEEAAVKKPFISSEIVECKHVNFWHLTSWYAALYSIYYTAVRLSDPLRKISWLQVIALTEE